MFDVRGYGRIDIHMKQMYLAFVSSGGSYEHDVTNIRLFHTKESAEAFAFNLRDKIDAIIDEFKESQWGLPDESYNEEADRKAVESIVALGINSIDAYTVLDGQFQVCVSEIPVGMTKDDEDRADLVDKLVSLSAFHGFSLDPSVEGLLTREDECL